MIAHAMASAPKNNITFRKNTLSCLENAISTYTDKPMTKIKSGMIYNIISIFV